MSTSSISENQATGGAAGEGGTDGQGIGGGIYNAATFYVDGLSLIEGNEASTSNDDVFGPLLPL